MRRIWHYFLSLIIFSSILFSSSKYLYNQSTLDISSFLRSDSPINAFNIETLISQQIELGPRIPGTNASLAFKGWLQGVIPENWFIEVKNFTYDSIELRNYWISTSDSPPEYIIGAHYDSRAKADQDLQNQDAPVPGANDGGSGVAAILEMLNYIPSEIQNNVGFVLFDAEDQGGINLNNRIVWSWIIGSTKFVQTMSVDQINKTKGFILLDMIGDDNLEIPWERGSDANLIDEIWGMAGQLGYGSIFVNKSGFTLIDDHVPFIKAGIPSVDIIDFNYPEWHTTKDDLDAIDPVNIAIVTDVILSWLTNKYDVTGSHTTRSGAVKTTSKTTSYFTNPTVNTKESEVNTINSSTNSLNTIIDFQFLIIPILLLFQRKIKKHIHE